MKYRLSSWKKPGTKQYRVYVNVVGCKVKVWFTKSMTGGIQIAHDPHQDPKDFPQEIYYLSGMNGNMHKMSHAIGEEVLEDQGITWESPFEEILGCAD